MIANEQESWEMSKSEINRLKTTCFYINDNELQKLIRQKEEVLAEIVPSSTDYLCKKNEFQWTLIRSLNTIIDDRVKMNAELNKILLVYFSIIKPNVGHDGNEYGINEDYVRNLSNELFHAKISTDHCHSNIINAEKIKDYQNFIFCCNSYISTNNITKIIINYFDIIKDKNIVLLPYKLPNINRYIPSEIIDKIKIIHIKEQNEYDNIIQYFSQNNKSIKKKNFKIYNEATWNMASDNVFKWNGKAIEFKHKRETICTEKFLVNYLLTILDEKSWTDTERIKINKLGREKIILYIMDKIILNTYFIDCYDEIYKMIKEI